VDEGHAKGFFKKKVKKGKKSKIKSHLVQGYGFSPKYFVSHQ